MSAALQIELPFGHPSSAGSWISPVEASALDASSLNSAGAAISAPVPAVFSGERKYTGVYSDRPGKHRASIHFEGANRKLGRFNTPEIAARAYDLAAAPLGRPLNFPGELEASARIVAEARGEKVVRACLPTGNTGAPVNFRSPPPLVVVPAGPMQGMDEAARLMAQRPPRPMGKSRAEEEAQIAAFLSEYGAVKCVPTGPVSHGEELKRIAAIAAQREEISRHRFRSGASVWVWIFSGGTRHRHFGVISKKSSSAKDRIAVDVNIEGRTVRQLVHRNLVVPMVRKSAQSTGEKA